MDPPLTNCSINKRGHCKQLQLFLSNYWSNPLCKHSSKQKHNYKNILKRKIAFSFEFSLLVQETVFKIISKINSKHSCGHDDISTILMKNICPLILSPITLILNQSLSIGIFPDILKMSKIIPLFKKEDPHKLDNYRPISLLPAFSKIFEKAVIYNYMNISIKIISYIKASMDFTRYIQQN